MLCCPLGHRNQDEFTAKFRRFRGEEDGEDHVLDGFLNDFANPAEHDDHAAAAATFGLFGESINDGGLSPVQVNFSNHTSSAMFIVYTTGFS